MPETTAEAPVGEQAPAGSCRLFTWPKVGTKVPCPCGGVATVFAQPPRGPIESSPPSAICDRGHLAMQLPDATWSADPKAAIVAWAERRRGAC